jgi:hypothetical protein
MLGLVTGLDCTTTPTHSSRALVVKLLQSVRVEGVDDVMQSSEAKRILIVPQSGSTGLVLEIGELVDAAEIGESPGPEERNDDGAGAA